MLIKKTIIIPSIKTRSTSNDDHTVFKQQPDPAKNVTKASGIWLIHGDYEMVQHIIPINKTGQ